MHCRTDSYGRRGDMRRVVRVNRARLERSRHRWYNAHQKYRKIARHFRGIVSLVKRCLTSSKQPHAQNACPKDVQKTSKKGRSSFGCFKHTRVYVCGSIRDIIFLAYLLDVSDALTPSDKEREKESFERLPLRQPRAPRRIRRRLRDEAA